MNEYQKKRLTELKGKNQGYAMTRHLKNNVLLQECLTKLEGHFSFATNDISSNCINVVSSILCNRRFLIKELQTIEEIMDILKDKTVYIVWDEATLPILQCNTEYVIKYIDDVSAVSFDTWILSGTMDKVICIDHNNHIIYYGRS